MTRPGQWNRYVGLWVGTSAPYNWDDPALGVAAENENKNKADRPTLKICIPLTGTIKFIWCRLIIDLEKEGSEGCWVDDSCDFISLKSG